MRIILGHVVESGGSVSCSLQLYTVMPPSISPQCEAIVPIRLKVCKSCQHVFRAKRKAEHDLPGKAMKRMRMMQLPGMKLSLYTSKKSHGLG